MTRMTSLLPNYKIFTIILYSSELKHFYIHWNIPYMETSISWFVLKLKINTLERVYNVFHSTFYTVHFAKRMTKN